jgi:transcription termination/antitermination protein NusG
MIAEYLESDKHDNWYALFVKTGAEHKILEELQNLKSNSIQFHVPNRELRIRQGGRWRLEVQPMFPGYILANGQLSMDSYYKIKQLTDVFTWISDENGPLPISPDEIGNLKKLLDKQDIIRISKVFYEGDKVVVIDGPLLGNEAIIRKVDRRKGRVKIALSMFGNSGLIDISVDSIYAEET